MNKRIASVAGILSLPVFSLLHAEAPKLTPEAFRGKLSQDTAALPSGGQLQMSYAPVVEKILPCVVRVTTYSKEGAGRAGHFGGGGGGRGMDEEKLRELFRQFGFPVPEGDEDFGQDDDLAPRRKGPGGRGNDPDAEEEEEADQKSGTGSGVIISKDGFILTNNHVVDKADRLEVIVGNSTKAYAAKVIGKDPMTDVALIKIEGANFPAATLGNSDQLRVGDIVLAAGSPMDLAQSVSQGIVSAIGRTGMSIVRERTKGGMISGFENFIQTDAAINPGNSGGPLVDGMGRVVGINTAIFTRSGMSAGIGFSIPVNLALRIAEDLVDDGVIRRGFLGVQMTDLSGPAAKEAGLDDGGGVVVTVVTKGSAAEASGVEGGDIIVSANNQRTEGSAALRSIVGGAREGATMPIEIIRDGQRKTLTVTLKGATDTEIANRSMRGGPTEEVQKAEPVKPDVIVTGVTCAEITPGMRQRYDVPGDVQGAVVVKVEPNSPAATAGIEEGDVILSINQKPVKTLAEAKANKPKGRTAILKISRAGETISVVINDE